MTDQYVTEDGQVDVDAVRERLTGESTVHRLRDWTDGDTLFGFQLMDPGNRATIGKTFREGGEYGESAENKAREHYDNTTLRRGVEVLYRATVQDPREDPPLAMDPGEPPLKYATLTDVEILDAKTHGEDGDRDD